MIEDLKLKNIFLTISAVLFALSLTQKCYCTISTCSDSIMVFILGWAAAFSGAGITWLANPLLFASWALLKKKLKTAMILSSAAALLSLFFLMFSSITDNENNQAKEIVSYQPGYWLWMGSCVVMLIGTFTLMLRHNTRVFRAKQQMNNLKI